MRKIIFGIYCIFILLFLILSFRYFKNESFISDYNKGIYKENDVESLLFLNYPQSYVAYYNLGNVYYQEKDYYAAISQYNKALEYDMPEKKECKVRINLALAILKTIDELDLKKDKNEILEILDTAENVLVEEGCAHKEDDNGHSKDAEKLQEDIEKMRKKLEEQDDKEENEEDDDEKKKEEQQPKDEVEEKLKEIQAESIKEREKGKKQRESLDDFSFYSGKKW